MLHIETGIYACILPNIQFVMSRMAGLIEDELSLSLLMQSLISYIEEERFYFVGNFIHVAANNYYTSSFNGPLARILIHNV